MKRVLLGCGASVFLFAGSAYAADLPVKAPIYKAPVAVAYNWTGFYLGGNVGYGWSHTTTTNVNGNAPFPAGSQSSFDQKGVLGGLQGGYNYQLNNNWLVGVEGEFSWANIKGDFSEFSSVAGFTANRFDASHSKVDWMATATTRLGYVANNWLLYAKGGAAWAHKKADSTTNDPTAGNVLRATTSGDITRTGWTVGGGVEWGFLAHWSAKLEYDYLDFGTERENRSAIYLIGTGLNPLLKDVSLRVNVVKIGVNYHFN